NSSRNSRLLKRAGPAAGHRSDPDWQPSDEDLDEADLEADLEDDLDDAEHESPGRSVVVAEAVVDSDAEPDYLDVDVVGEDSGALPVAASATSAVEEQAPEEQGQTDELELEFEAEAPGELQDEYEPEPEGVDDEYEYVADSSGLEAPSESEPHLADSLSAARRRRYESKTSAAVSARKYKFRKRMLTVLAVAVVASAATAVTVAPAAWWALASIGAVTVLYLAYLRRQTRIEERLRRRRAQRIARARLGVENTDDREFDVVPSRLRRPGSVVLEIDDEDPIFEHLDYAPFSRGFDLPRAAGQ
ncbi:MAG TPA: gephyrin-like molybdotransferase receptor GlpR, partial [Mycobacterium sp.]|nr:gephyrin-like molybdotransferase receptor GlpR [Mycobacterium sp.]